MISASAQGKGPRAYLNTSYKSNFRFPFIKHNVEDRFRDAFIGTIFLFVIVENVFSCSFFIGWNKQLVAVL